MNNVGIVGSGIAGVQLGLFLQQHGVILYIFEKNERRDLTGLEAAAR